MGLKQEHTPYIIEWWPPQSPDLSPIENFWSWIDRIKRSVAFEMGLDRMKSVVNNIMWGRDPTTGQECPDAKKKLNQVLRNHLMSWIDRLEACVEAGGGWTNY
eukprot:GDKK01074292.1.p1 GENE.GDKK01074292.1~~GDKK01074292.1.p1  ORF type:complete len:103 (+),score=5.29 GDKK01074292.1:1-309(+)